MFNESGIDAIMQFGALGLLGAFMYLLFQSYKNQTDFQQKMMIRIMKVIEENTSAHRQAALKSEAVCTAIEDNRVMEKEEHKALMDEHKILMQDHRRITERLSS